MIRTYARTFSTAKTNSNGSNAASVMEPVSTKNLAASLKVLLKQDEEAFFKWALAVSSSVGRPSFSFHESTKDQLINSVSPTGALCVILASGNAPGALDRKIISSAVKRIEEEYFEAARPWFDAADPFSTLLLESEFPSVTADSSFRSVVHSLPAKYKAVLMGFIDESPIDRTRPPKLTPDEVRARWHKLDPVDMESVERDHYLKTGQILRTRHVEATSSPVPVGSRLRQILGMDFLEHLEALNCDDFITLASCLVHSPKNAIFHRDLKFDAQFAICKKLMSMSTADVGIHIVSVTSILSVFETNLETPTRVWNRKVIPAIRTGLATVENVSDNLNEPSRWALVASNILSCGRVKMTPRLLNTLCSKFDQSMESVDRSILYKLLDGFVVSGTNPIGLIRGLNHQSMSISLLAQLIQTRNHFGIFGDDFDLLVTQLVVELQNQPDLLRILSEAQRVMILNGVFSSTEEPSEAIAELVTDICAKLPDLDLDVLGTIDSIVE
jgi:hypothetical protein